MAKKSSDQRERDKRTAKLLRLRLAWVTAMVHGEDYEKLRVAEVEARWAMIEK